MRKLLSVMLSVVLAAGCVTLTGCGDSGKPASNADNSSYEEDNNGDSGEDSAEDSSSNFDSSYEITVVSREEGSGTRGAFIELFGVQEKDADGNKIDNTTVEAMITNSTSVTMTTVAGNEYAIGYASLGSLDDTTKAVKIDGVEATAENIKNGSYTVSRPFNIVTKGEVSETAQDFIDYIMSAEGQAVADESGYIAVDDQAPAYAGNKPAGKVVIAGSSSVTPVMEKLKEAYLEVNTEAEIEIQESDSTTGVTSTQEGTCDIGMASRELQDSEIESGVEAQAIALDGIAVIVNKENPIEDMTKDQVKDIFTGAVTDWASVIE